MKESPIVTITATLDLRALAEEMPRRLRYVSIDKDGTIQAHEAYPTADVNTGAFTSKSAELQIGPWDADDIAFFADGYSYVFDLDDYDFTAPKEAP